MLFCWSQGRPRTGRMFRFAGVYPGQTRGSCVSPSVHRQPALFRDRAGSTRASVERRSTSANRASHRSGDRTTARLRVRRLHRSRGRRGGDPALQPATVQGAAPGGERSATAGRSSPRPATRRLQQPAARRRALGVQQSPARRLLAAARRRWRRAPGSRSRNFGPDAPPKNKRKPPRKDSDRGPKGPIKERPVSRIYDADEDWRAKDDAEEAEVDNFATSAKKDDVSGRDETRRLGEDET